MTAYHFLLFFHLVGAFCFFAGGATAGTLQIGALRREPSEILTLLRLTRVGVLLVLAGAVHLSRLSGGLLLVILGIDGLAAVTEARGRSFTLRWIARRRRQPSQWGGLTKALRLA